MADVAIVATGSCVPTQVRKNDDPIFRWLHEHQPEGSKLFDGYDQRRILSPGETVVDILIPAAQAALTSASVAASQVDLVVGYASIGTWAMPNDLATVAAKLGVPATTPVVPINDEYANFNASVVAADALIRAGRASTALVVVGTDWTRYVDYHTPPAVSAGDGAGAAVLTTSHDPSRLRVLDMAVAYDYEYLGGMYVAADETTPPQVPPAYLAPVFHLDDLGIAGFKTFGVNAPPTLVQSLLDTHGIAAADVAFVGHQTSSVLNDAWRKKLDPGQFVQTLSTLANMTAASIPVNLDRCYADIETPYVALVALGPEVSCNVVLLERTLP